MVFAPGQRFVHPEFGDITADVIEALQEMARPNDPVIIEREQAEIAAAAGQVTKDLAFGRVVAQVHGDSFDYWTRREGLGFWKDKGNLKRFLADNPACVVKSEGRGVQVHAGARRTRLRTIATGVPTNGAGLTRPGKGRFSKS
jgi:hypothetical protein